MGVKMVRIDKLPSGNVGLISIVVLGLVATITIGIPVENLPAEQPGNGTEVPAISELRASNSGLNSITLKWASPPGAEIDIYKIYMDEILIDTVDGNSHIYTISKLSPGNWYNFHVDACDPSGKCSIGGSIAGASTLTVQEATEGIIMKVENLTSNGMLNAAQGESLIRNLAAIYQLDNLNAKTTITQLQFFIDNINVLIAEGVLPQGSGQDLIAATEDIIRNLS